MASAPVPALLWGGPPPHTPPHTFPYHDMTTPRTHAVGRNTNNNTGTMHIMHLQTPHHHGEQAALVPCQGVQNVHAQVSGRVSWARRGCPGAQGPRRLPLCASLPPRSCLPALPAGPACSPRACQTCLQIWGMQAVIGSGVLYLPVFFAVLGWVGGIIVTLLFGAITW